MAQGIHTGRSGLRRFVSILALGTIACAGLFAKDKGSVPGMSQFTETGFGFSFWYPAAWRVTDEPVDDPTRGGWFPGATIVKELKIQNPATSEDNEQPPGVILEEILAPEGLTELGQSASASPVGVDGRYFFDSGLRRWMYTQLSDGPNGSPRSTNLVEIRQRTVGGLPIFWGAVRHGGEVIVPLDASHFLAISTLDVGGYDSHVYLAPTVEATHPEGSKRTSVQAQAVTIRREGIKLRAIGESLGYWYKDNQHVYNQSGEVIPGADPQTFVLLSSTEPIPFFAADKVHVYTQYGAAIPGADPKTFVMTSPSAARDAHHTYDWSSGNLHISSAPAHD